MAEIDKLTLELIYELDKMTVEELQQFRPEIMGEMERAGHLHPASEWLLNTVFDLVIQKKQKGAVVTV